MEGWKPKRRRRRKRKKKLVYLPFIYLAAGDLSGAMLITTSH
jgi:hypothetical protein